jgi:hypothetical protein
MSKDPNLEHRRLTDQFYADFIGDDGVGDEHAIALLQMNGCDFFRKSSSFNKDTDRLEHRMTGWRSVPVTPEDGVRSSAFGVFYRPLPTPEPTVAELLKAFEDAHGGNQELQ